MAEKNNRSSEYIPGNYKTEFNPQSLANTNSNFKPINLLAFSKKMNIMTYLKLFDCAMYRADNMQKASTFLNSLDYATAEMIMPEIMKMEWLYKGVYDALIRFLGSSKRVIT